MINKITKLTCDLIKIRSESKNQKEVEKAQEFVKKYLDKNTKNFDLKIFEKNGVKTYYYKKNNDGPEICLCGHIDVIPANQSQYEAKTDNKYIYGRGSGDMKSGLAVLIELFIEHNDKNLSLLITGDEEIGSLNGAKNVYNKINPELLLITEPTNNEILLIEKGGIWLNINIKGPGGHASRPHLARNCIDILYELINNIRKEINATQKDEWKNTVNIGSIEGGNYSISKNFEHESANIIATKASARLDIRLIETTSHEYLIKKIKKIIKQKQDELGKKYLLSYEEIYRVDHLNTKKTNKYVKIFKKCCEEHKIKPKIKKGPAASDGRFFSKKGIPVIIFGPKSTGHHSDKEHADIKTINNTYKILNAFIRKIR